MRVAHRFYEIETIPVSLAIDGAVAPDAIATLSSTNKAQYRDFSGADWQDLFFEWQKPYSVNTTEIYVRLEGWITSATAPVNTDDLKWRVRGCAIDHKGLLSTAMGAWTTYSNIFDLGWAQYMRFQTSMSEVVVAGITADTDSQRLIFQIQRDPTDSYAQKIGIGAICIKYFSKELCM